MNAIAENPRVAIGGNNPPGPLDPVEVQRVIREQNIALFNRVAELVAAAAGVPKAITDEEANKKASDVAKALGKAIKALKDGKTIAMEPYKTAASAAGATFQANVDTLQALRDDIDERRQPWLERKAAEEQARRDEEARQKREAELEAMRRLEEANRQRQEAEAAKAKAEAEMRAAQAARDKALADAADAKRREQEAKDNAERASARAEAERARAHAIIAKADMTVAGSTMAEASRVEKAAARDEKVFTKVAVAADRQAERHEKAAEASPAELSRTRGDLGSVSGLNQYWAAEVDDFDRLDKAKLWPFIDREAISAAVYKWMKAQPAEARFRQMPGARMFIDTGVRTT